MDRDRKQILKLVSVAGEMNGLSIYDVEFNSSLLRVYIEGSQVSMCEKFMKSLLFLLRSEGISIPCEVSSPGLERHLRKSHHFISALGKQIKVQAKNTLSSYDERNKITKKKTVLCGRLSAYKDQNVYIDDGFSEWVIPIHLIKKAHVVFENKRA